METQFSEIRKNVLIIGRSYMILFSYSPGCVGYVKIQSKDFYLWIDRYKILNTKQLSCPACSGEVLQGSESQDADLLAQTERNGEEKQHGDTEFITVASQQEGSGFEPAD